MLNADVFNLTLSSHRILHSWHMCASFCLVHTLLVATVCTKDTPNETAFTFSSATPILRSIGKARSEGGEGEQCTMLTIAKQDETAISCWKTSSANSICCHSAAAFPLLTRRLCTWICTIDVPMLTMHTKRWKEHIHGGANVACRFSTFRWPLWRREKHLCRI